MIKESYPLVWPAGWPRITRPQDRLARPIWKKNSNQYRVALELELKRMGAPSFVISSNIQVDSRGKLLPGPEPLDVGVSIWFSRKEDQDFAWQDTFGIHEVAPTVEQINAAYRKLAAIYHPDVPGTGDHEIFMKLDKTKQNALNYINRHTDQALSYSIACDTFKELRLNMAAIVGTIQAIRKIERCGTSAMLERAYEGFKALPETSASSKAAAGKK
jgi:hypothetical protein